MKRLVASGGFFADDTNGTALNRPIGLLCFLCCALVVGNASACPIFASSFEDQPVGPAADLCDLSDEFDDAATLADWQRLFELEGWPGDQLEQVDIDTTRAGYLTMLPYTSSWFEDLKGVLMFKPVSGDFVVSTRFEATNRAATGAPQALYSLAGLFVRTPRAITEPADWTPGGENYIFLSSGSADTPGTFQYEVKTTINSNSILNISPACTGGCAGIPTFELRATRLETDHFILLRREQGGDWIVHRRFGRSDMPATLQVGLTTYTDWGSIDGPYWPGDQFGHNNTVITDGNPDLLAQFDHVRFQRPAIPIEFQGRDFSADYDADNPATVSDQELLSFLRF